MYFIFIISCEVYCCTGIEFCSHLEEKGRCSQLFFFIHMGITRLLLLLLLHRSKNCWVSMNNMMPEILPLRSEFPFLSDTVWFLVFGTCRCVVSSRFCEQPSASFERRQPISTEGLLSRSKIDLQVARELLLHRLLYIYWWPQSLLDSPSPPLMYGPLSWSAPSKTISLPPLVPHHVIHTEARSTSISPLLSTSQNLCLHVLC